MNKENVRVGITGFESQAGIRAVCFFKHCFPYIMNIIIPHNIVKHIESDDMCTEELVFVCKKT